jgi:hypothetical protein
LLIDVLDLLCCVGGGCLFLGLIDRFVCLALTTGKHGNSEQASSGCDANMSELHEFLLAVICWRGFLQDEGPWFFYPDTCRVMPAGIAVAACTEGLISKTP